jgi:CRP-like cAMP-binding protein
MPPTTDTSRMTDLFRGRRAMPAGSFLQHLSTEAWQEMLQRTPRQRPPRARTFQRDELLPLGRDDRNVYVVMDGCVRQDRFPLGGGEGMPTITRFRGVGQFVGEAKLIDSVSSVLTRCLTRTTVIPWHVRDMHVLHRRMPEAQLALLRSLEHQNRSDELVYAMTPRPPVERVGRLFVHLADIAGVPDPRVSDHTVITGPSQKDMAAALQLSISTVENAIRTLRYHGAIDVGYRKFTLHDLSALGHSAAGA